jgi:hypothetical protein
MFSFVFEKHPSKDEKEAASKKKTNRGMVALEQGWTEILSDCKHSLTDVGIPV